LPDFDASIRSNEPDQTAALDEIAQKWGLGSSLTRVQAAFAKVSNIE
jgi:hypothetical protein